MAVVQMSKINILLHKEDKSRVLDLLQNEGVMEIVDRGEDTLKQNEFIEEGYKIDYKLAETEFALKFLAPYAPLEKGIEGMLLGEKVKIASFNEVDVICQTFFYQDVIEQCKNIEEELNQLKIKQSETAQELNELTPWIDLDFNLEDKRETLNTKLIIGTIDKTKSQQCFEDIQAISDRMEYAALGEIGNKVRFWMIADKNNLKAIESILQANDFSEFIITDKANTPAQITKRLQSKQTEILNRIDQLTTERKKAAIKAPELKIIYDHLTWLKGKENAKQKLVYTDSVVSINGFIPRIVFEKLEKDLAEISTNIVLSEVEVTEEDIVPVELSNGNFVRPFENVMKLFGMPSSQEADPTPYLTPFFLIFFGFCLTDVGYGLILGLGLWMVLRFVKLPKDMKEMVRLIMYGGWVTVIMGILFGGYMGITPEQAPAFMVNAETGLFKGQIFDPINNLNAAMGFAYGLGLLHLWLGTFIKGLRTAKTSLWEALQTSFSYNLLILLLIFYSLSAADVFLGAYSNVLKNIVLAFSLFTVWGSGHGIKNIIVRPLIGAINFLQEIIGIFSAVLSYSRLFALGLSTGIIALVFNTIALTTMEILPIYIAIPVMVIIIIIGHTLNIALNVLGAFIHSARLQFVEFFGKFLIGGGKEFTPFKKEMKYIYYE